jgi:SAM-dependent methyltransferase
VEKIELPDEVQRSRQVDRAAISESALALLERLAVAVDRPDLGEVSILDVGCGVKFTEALINQGLPIGSYTGVDVHRPVIETLLEAVDDPRFDYHHVDFYNARYNTAGRPMQPGDVLPVGDRTFDLICGFSLVTHLDPEDTATILEIVSRVAHPDTVLVFTAYLDRRTPGGHGVIDRYSEALGADATVGEDYREFDPNDPLRVALYSEQYLRTIVEDSPWTVVSIDDPTPYAQHLFTCRLSPS